jgi:hypothetical protein
MRAIDTSSSERNYRRGFRVRTAALVASVLLTVSSSALAFPDFPGIIVDELNRTATGPEKPGITCTPTCSLCHTSPSPDSGNADQHLALDLLSFAMPLGRILEPKSLPAFLDALENQPCPTGAPGPCDGDGDGQADIYELRRDLNPNGPGELACPQYGCGARIAPERPTRPLDGAAALAALSAAAVLVRRWRRR